MTSRAFTLAAELLHDDPDLVAVAQGSTTYAELAAKARRVTVGAQSYCVVEGDLLLDEDELQLYSLRIEATHRAELTDPAPSIPLGPSAALTGISVAGKAAQWDPQSVLTYCIFRVSFPTSSEYETVRNSMAEATNAWEEACGISFHHRDNHDGFPNPAIALDQLDPELTFAVRYVDGEGNFIASSFFPTSPPPRRRIFIDPSYFASDQRFDRVGVLRHELGHVLGFRHEHIRSGAPAICPNEDTRYLIDLTKYDPTSVMHYFCGDVGSVTLELSELDVQGAQKLYGPPHKPPDAGRGSR
jgi:hypothetical protein